MSEPTARDRRVTALRKVLEEALRDPERGSAIVAGELLVDDTDIERAADAALTWFGDVKSP